MKIPRFFLAGIKPQRLLAAGALVTPVLLVQAARLMFGAGGPAVTQAAPPANSPAPALQVPAVAPRLTEQQKKALAWLHENADARIIASPFAKPAAALAAQPTIVQTSEPTPTITQTEPGTTLPDEVQRLTLSALVRGGGGAPCALMAGRVYRVGDAVVDGWTVTSIDAEARRVIVTGAAGATVEVKQAR